MSSNGATAEVTMLQTQPPIKLFGPEAFEGMHRAGRLTATILDQLTDLIKPGVTTQEIDDAVMDFASAQQGRASDAELSRLRQIQLHIDQPCRLPWHSQHQSLCARAISSMSM
jgi:hypothetical protein